MYNTYINQHMYLAKLNSRQVSKFYTFWHKGATFTPMPKYVGV